MVMCLFLISCGGKVEHKEVKMKDCNNKCWEKK